MGGWTFDAALPVDRNDGVLWAGRGATIALQGGLGAEWRWMRAQLAPVAFGAQNAGFALAPNGRTGSTTSAQRRPQGRP